MRQRLLNDARLRLPLSGLAMILVLVGTLLSAVAAGGVYYYTRHHDLQSAETEASVFADALAQRSRIAQAYLRAVAARMRGADLLTESEFANFVGFLGPEPALEKVAWVPRVSGDDRRSFEAQARREGSLGYLIRERHPEGGVTEAGERAEYMPIRFAAGSGASPEDVGLDIATEPAYSGIIAEALESRRTAATPPLVLDIGHPGFLLVEPVLTSDRSGRSLEGLVAGMFRLDLLVAAAAPAPLITRNAVIQDLDAEARPLAVRSTQFDFEVLEAWPYKDITLGGRSWRVFIEPLPGQALRNALLVLLVGLTLTGVTVVLADRGQQRLIAQDLRREVARQTAALQRSTAEFKALFEEGGTGKCEMVPETQRFRRVNLRLCEMLGYEPDDLVQLGLNDVLHLEDAVSAEPAYRALLDGESDDYLAEKRFVRRDGSFMWCDMSATVLRDEVGRPVWTVAVIQDIAARKQAEDARQLLVRELAHRVKNTLQVARSLADQTGRYASDLESFLPLYQGRLRALGMAHDQLFKTDWGGARLDDIVAATLAVFGPDTVKRVHCDLPDLLLPSAATQTLALILNELATNASKYGALSNHDGEVSLIARLEVGDTAAGEPPRRLALEWTERGGPPPQPPKKPGFGMTFLTRAVQHQHGGSTGFEWAEEGVRYTLRLPLHEEAAVKV